MKPIQKTSPRRWVPIIVKGTEAELEQGEEESEPEWIPLSDIFEQPAVLFRNMLFLEGLDCTSNTYVIVGDYLTVVDPGSNAYGFARLFDHPEYAPEDIKKIVLTNGNPDHTMGTLDLFRYPGVKNNPELEIILHEASPSEFKNLLSGFGVQLTEIMGGETLDLGGFRFDVLSTPCVSTSAACLCHSETGTVIPGDVALTCESMDSEFHVYSRPRNYLSRLGSLLGLDISFVLPGHGQVVNAVGSWLQPIGAP